MSTILVTGATRGIGFELVKQYAADANNTVIGTSRSLEKIGKLAELKGKNVHVIRLDLADSLDTIKNDFVQLQKLAPNGVDVVVQSAGIGLNPPPGVHLTNVDLDNYTKNFDTNVVGSIKVYQAVYPYWAKESSNTKKFIFISSALGWTNNYLGLPSFGYGLSKAGINYFAREAAHFHTQSAIEPVKSSVTVAVHPGVVATDLARAFVGLSSVPGIEVLTPLECVEKLKRLFDGLAVEDNGTFKNNDGSSVLW